jgi:hypothetical protein
MTETRVVGLKITVPNGTDISLSEIDGVDTHLQLVYNNGEEDFGSERRCLHGILPFFLPCDSHELLINDKLREMQDEIFRLRREYQKVNLERIKYKKAMKGLERAFPKEEYDW